MGTFLPQQVAEKRKILQDIAGTIPGVNDGGTVGPYDLLKIFVALKWACASFPMGRELITASAQCP